MRAPVLWLTSYPKSGNTWFRFAVFHLLHGRMPDSSRDLDTLFNSKLPVRAGENLKKSHAQHALLSSDMTDEDKVIYIVRHPLDVLQSSLNYAVLNGEVPATSTGHRDWISDYVTHGGHPPWIGAPYNAGSWNSNVSGWTSQPAERVLAIKYEDALKDAHATLASCARFLALDVTGADIDACADATSFDQLRAFEERELEIARALNTPQGRFSIAPRLAAAETGARFFNRGQAGAYREVLSADEVCRAWAVFEPVASRLGYQLSAE